MISILFSLILFTSACKEVDKLTQFNMDYDESVTIPSTIGINLPFNLFTPPITTNSTESFEVNDTRKDLIEQIILKEMTLSISSPSGEDFSFLKSIEIYMSADGLDEIKVAWKDTIDNSVGNSIALETSSSDLQEYIKKDDINLKVTTVTDELILTDYEVNIHSNFFVDAKILGI